MTNSPLAASLAFETFEGALAALRERGLRVSAPRRMLLEALFAADGPVAAERVAAALHLDPGSVYRNLDTFERHGLVQHVHLGHGPGLYVLVGEGKREYLCCERCGAVLTLTPGQLAPVRGRIRELFGYTASFAHHAIVGVCETCSEARSRAGRGSGQRRARPRSGDPRDGGHAHEHSHGNYVHSHAHAHGTAECVHEHGH
jgi:Fur family transcriptional regulator, ferric uptake regulator